jgi:hypothetical protein
MPDLVPSDAHVFLPPEELVGNRKFKHDEQAFKSLVQAPAEMEENGG